MGAALVPEPEYEPEFAYDQAKDESDKAYAAFCAYRDLGPAQRSIQKAADAHGKSWGTMRDWHDRHNWRARVSAWDRALEAKKRDALDRAIEEMGERQATQGQGLQRALMVPNQALLQRLADNPDEIRQLATMDIVKLIEVATRAAAVWPNVMKAERLARGESTEKVSSDGTPIRVEHVIRPSADGDYSEYLRALADSGDDSGD